MSPDGRVVIMPAISGPDGDPACIAGAAGDAGGSVTFLADQIEYIAGPTLGTETITYTVLDSRGANATGTITITIQ